MKLVKEATLPKSVPIKTRMLVRSSEVLQEDAIVVSPQKESLILFPITIYSRRIFPNKTSVFFRKFRLKTNELFSNPNKLFLYRFPISKCQVIGGPLTLEEFLTDNNSVFRKLGRFFLDNSDLIQED